MGRAEGTLTKKEPSGATGAVPFTLRWPCALRLSRRTDAGAWAEIEREATVRGHFVRAAEAIEDPERRRRVVLTGLRALEGRRDLEVA